jgi:phosphoglycerate dehydrogenase-like enzyme
LTRALQERWIAGAALDAHDIEPVPDDSPLWSMPNVIITPHTGAVSHGTAERRTEIVLENLRRFVAGEPLMNVVDKHLGY